MRSKKVRFKGSLDYELGALLDMPQQSPKAYALFAHCFTCTKNLKAVGNITKALAGQGMATLRFDFTGLGESAGDFADTNFSSNIEDLQAAATFLKEEYAAPCILIGHSLGGAAVLQAAAGIPSVKAVATIGAPHDPEHVTHLLQSKKEQIEQDGEAEVNLAGRTFRIRKQFLDDLSDQRMTQNIANLRRALMIFHSPIDDIVGIDNAARIFQDARHPKSFVSLDQADHLLMKAEDSTYVGRVIAAWSEKYM